MMYIMVIGCIGAKHLEPAKQEAVIVVVIDSLAGGKDEEEHRLTE